MQKYLKDPCSVYPPVPGIKCSDFQLPPGGIPPAQLKSALQQLRDYQSAKKARFLGFQANQKLDFGDLSEYLSYHINNIGDPFRSGNFGVNSKWIERAVLDYYARLWNAPYPHEPKNKESYWGYVLSMGSTEGNMYGLWNARDYLGGKALLHDLKLQHEALRASLDGRERPLPPSLAWVQAAPPEEAADNPKYFVPVAFCSEDTHYSIHKLLRVLGIEVVKVKSQGGGAGPGSIDLRDLVAKVEERAKERHPILISFNYGTTFKGAFDEVEVAGELLMPIFKKYGHDKREIKLPNGKKVIRTGYWFHVDGALGAAYMPYLEKSGFKIPIFDFRLPFVHSISMSGHKWIGAPWPCGIYMTRTKYQLNPTDKPQYIGSPDSTFAGSRNGFSALILWYYLARTSEKEQQEKAKRLLQLTADTVKKLKNLEAQLKKDLMIDLSSEHSLTVRFWQANAKIVEKYSLSNDELAIKGQKKLFSHIFLMDHVTPELIDSLISDLSQPGAFVEQPKEGAEVLSFEEAFGTDWLAEVPVTGRGFQ